MGKAQKIVEAFEQADAAAQDLVYDRSIGRIMSEQAPADDPEDIEGQAQPRAVSVQLPINIYD